MNDEQLQDAKARWEKISGRTYGIIDDFAMNRECAAVLQTVPDLLDEIDRLSDAYERQKPEMEQLRRDRALLVGQVERLSKAYADLLRGQLGAGLPLGADQYIDIEKRARKGLEKILEGP